MKRPRTKEEIRIAQQKKLVSKNLQKISQLMSKVEDLYNELPISVKNQIAGFHSYNTSLSSIVRWGQQNTDELLGSIDKITDDL